MAKRVQGAAFREVAGGHIASVQAPAELAQEILDFLAPLQVAPAGLGLLLAMMEPPPALTDEFNEWYDTEHIPQRAAIDGFHSTLRFVCNEGWPRFLAIYDLESLAVLDQPAYKAVSGEGFSAWSRRMLVKVSGQWRFSGRQLYPGTAVTAAQGTVAALLLIRWRGGKPEWQDDVVSGLRSNFEGRAGVLQVRAFAAAVGGTMDYIGLVEATLPLCRTSLDLAAFGDSGKGIDLVNLYSPYWRRGTMHAIYR